MAVRILPTEKMANTSIEPLIHPNFRRRTCQSAAYNVVYTPIYERERFIYSVPAADVGQMEKVACSARIRSEAATVETT